ncbi:hypothetical protein [Streptomyces griseorubiginosus]|uniref:hypothetical protein n=1 Tax=Streptomyces griseorubiginosus TaxID=67304 RepID=UPI00332C20DF
MRVEDQGLPAAVVNLLLGDGEVTPKAIETTALEMARIGRLKAEHKADGTVTVRPVPGKAAPASTASPYRKASPPRPDSFTTAP